MTMSIKVLCKVKVATEAVVEELEGLFAVPASAAVESFLSVSFSGGAVTSLSITTSEAVGSSLTNEVNKALVLLANTPKSIREEVRVSNTSQTRAVQTFSRREILCSAWKTKKNLHI